MLLVATQLSEIESCMYMSGHSVCWKVGLWASYPIRKIAGCACPGNAGNVSPTLWVNDPYMHHGTGVTHVPWCMPGSPTSGFLWSLWRGKRSPGILGACATLIFTYLARGPWDVLIRILVTPPWLLSQRTHVAMLASLLAQNDVALT